MRFYWFWLFLLYSFEVCAGEAVCGARRSPHQVRNAFCCCRCVGVLRRAMLAVLHLPPDMTGTFWRLALYGGLTATAWHVVPPPPPSGYWASLFWDYSATKMDLNRRSACRSRWYGGRWRR